MYYEKYFPFCTAFSNPIFWEDEKKQETEFELMKSYYPETAMLIQEITEKECNLLDYEGSRLYDEYPDRFMLHQLSKKITLQVQEEMDHPDVPKEYLDELVQVILYQEIYRKRYRRSRRRKYF